jgi:cellulose biosynthesis protein BcsQ
MVANNDLDLVFSEAGLDRAAYRSFPLTLQSRAAAAAPPATPVVPEQAAQESRHHQPSDHPDSRFGHRSPVLSGLLSQEGNRPTDAEAAAVGAITVVGAAGGVGATTITATLARISSRRGRRVLLLDGAVESLAPLYLGAGEITSASSTGWSFLPHPGSRQGTISVVACGADTEPGKDNPSPWQRARSLAGVAGDIFVDSGSYCFTNYLADALQESTCLVILAPDIRCVLQVRNIEKRLIDHGANSRPWYLLNHYDSEIPLHREVRASLAGHLGERLAPFTVRSAREIPQALHQGLTVVDYAPDSPVTGELVRAADWLREIGSPAKPLNVRKTAAGLP